MKNRNSRGSIAAKKPEMEHIRNEKHFANVVAVFPEAFVSGKFCDVKIVCMDTDLWAHRIILGSVSPFLQKLLVNYEKQGDDVVTLFLPMIKGYHMKLVLDYIYSGAMYLCGAHMQYVIQVMEVLQLKCGVSVNKIVGQNSGEFIEVEHGTVTIKTDQDPAGVKVNGIKDENLNDEKDGIYKLRKKSQSDTSTTNNKMLSKTKAVKRKRQSDAENNCLDSEKPDEKKGKKNSILDELPKSNLEITPIANNKCDTDLNENKASKESDIVSKEESSKNKQGEHSNFNNQTDDEDDSNDVVMVELDEEFVVEKVDSNVAHLDSSMSQEDIPTEVIASSENTKTHRCVLCGRTFKHYKNLQVHLTGHLGVKVNIHRCDKCKKNFRNKLELDLHMRSHRAAKMLAKHRGDNSVVSVTVNKVTGHKAKVITTVGSTDKKIVRKYLKSSDKKPSKVNKDKQSHVKSDGTKKKLSTPAAKQSESLTCAMCDKSFGVKSMFLRHVKKSHPELAVTLESHSQLKTLPSINIKKCSVSSPGPSTPIRTPILNQKKTAASPKSPLKSPIKSPMRQFSTPVSSSSSKSSKKKDRTKSESNNSLAPDLPDYYNTLECPDCERVFIAKSIFERHLQSAKHGIYGQCNTSNESDLNLSQSPVTPSLPHWTESPLSNDSGSGSPHKIECHLCGQSFVRVKDLAKHREKMCQAYHA